MKSVPVGKRGFPGCFRRTGDRCRKKRVESHPRARFFRERRFPGPEGVPRDIDESIRANREREKREAQLAQSRKREAMAVLADGIAHDFNNILSGILGLAEIVKGRCLPPTSPALSYLEDIVDAGARAKELIGQLRCLTLSGRDQRTPCRLHTLLDEVLTPVEVALPEGAGLKKAIRWKGAEILADAVQIRQMLLNILTNAVQSLDPLPGEIVVSLDRVEFTGPPLPHPDLKEGIFARLAVADTGGGIAAETLEKIFDPYFTTWKQKGGRGLGLSVAYGIARRHGGAVTVESEVGKGSLFTVYLPAISVGKERNHAKGSVKG